MSQLRFSNAPLAVMALALGGGSLQAAIVANSSTVTLYCDTVLGPTPATVGIKLSAAGSAVTVTATAPTLPVVLSGSASASVSSATTYTNFSFSVAPGCKGATNNQTQVLTFTPAGGTAIMVTATLSVTSAASALAPSPSGVTLTCLKSGSTYTPGASQTVSVTSPANSGTPFTVLNAAPYALPSWLSVTPLTGGTASATPVALTVAAASGCGGLAVGSTSFSVHLSNAPAPDKLLAVTIEVGGTSPLTASVSPIALSYTTGSSSYNAVTTSITSSPAAYFSVDATTLPLWLNVTPTTGTTPTTLSFTPTAGVKTLALGSYTANVHLQVSGDLDQVIPVTMHVENPAATLSVAEGTTRSLNWTIGTALPSLVITPVSSDSPISFGVTTSAGTLSPQVSETSGVAYSFGNPLTVTFLQSVFGAAAPGAALTGSVVITPTAAGSPITVAITVNVLSPGALITSISPTGLPTSSSGTYTVALTGSGFVVSSNPSIVTNVGIVTGGLIVQDSNIVANVINSTTIVLTITVPSSSDPYLPFSGSGGTVTLGACNPQGASCTTPTSTTTLAIGINPSIQAVTSASSFMQATPPALTGVAAYDILSVFGANFCVSGGTGCTGANALLYGQIDPVAHRYVTSLSPDAAGATQRNVTVVFQTHGRTPAPIASAPLLFVSNSQINLVVPDEVVAYLGKTVDMVVNFGYGTGSTMLSSATYSVTITATDPGVFSVGGDGQGDALAMSASYVLISTGNPAGMRAGTDSDTIQLYVTGLGKPDSTGSGSGYSNTCMPVESYWAAVNLATSVTPPLASNDGLVLQPSLFPTGEIQPCILSSGPDVPTVSIGGVHGTVTYAGWVADSVAGLYQINVQLPASTASFTDAYGVTGPISGTASYLPVIVEANLVSSQASGLNMWVVQRIQVTNTGATTGTHGTALAAAAIVGAQGTSPYTYAVSTGTLPAGLTLNSDGTITGTPSAAGSSTVVFLVTDANGLTGTLSVTFVIS